MTVRKALPVLDIAAGLAALMGLLPDTGALPGIADPAFPFANAIWFTVGVGGPFLLLAAGPRLLLRAESRLLYAFGFAALMGAAGAIRLRSAGYTNLILDWLAMALVVAGLLLLLRRPWLWGVVGGVWSGFLLGAFSSLGLYSYFVVPTRLFSGFLLFQFLASMLAIMVATINLKLRKESGNKA